MFFLAIQKAGILLTLLILGECAMSAAKAQGAANASATEVMKFVATESASAPVAESAPRQLAEPNVADPNTKPLSVTADNWQFLCGRIQGWDMACLRSRYQGLPSEWPRPAVDAGKSWREMAAVPPQFAPSNSRGAAQLALGAALFADPGLSRKGQVACASCHQADKSFTDGLAQSIGEDRLMGRRRTPPLFAAPFAPRLFWDGRAHSLEAQARGPITNPVEMNNTLAAALAACRT